jgi:hypothetical protein
MIDQMDDHRVEKVLEILRGLEREADLSSYFKPDYREVNDPILNGTLLFDGPEDLSETFEDAVREKTKGKLWQSGE